MSNHVHIVVCTGSEPLGTSVKRIGVRYAVWYNRKYNRQGALFQDRYRSEPIEDDRYLLTAVRYVHKNPILAGLCKDIAEYKWSSFTDYLGDGDGLTDTDFVLGLFSKELSSQIRLFKEFSGVGNDDVFADIGDSVCISDEALRKRIMNICGAGNVGEFQALSQEERIRAIRAMKNSGMSIRQIVRHTGVSFGLVRGIGR